jgi:anion-transporting  ArsA/GET3 family ATPase
MLVDSRPYQYFVAAAPGLKELLTIGKIWYEERKRDADTQQPRWDLIVVDLPATGHGLQYLNMPCAARDTFHEGIIHREAERITTWLRDAEKIAVNLVTTAEELPVSETMEAHQQLTDSLQLPLGALFVNRVREAPLSTAVLTHLQTELAHASVADLDLAEEVLACATIEANWTEAQDGYVQQLSQLSLPLASLPLCFSREFGVAQLELLAQRLTLVLQSEEPLVSAHHPKPRRKGTKASR